MVIVDGIIKNEIRLDEGLLLGRAVFETIRVGEKAWFLKEHIERINRGIKQFNIDNPISESWVYDQIKKYYIRNCALRITVTPKNKILSTRPILYNNEHYVKGFDITLSKIRRNSTSIVSYIKSTNYIENALEREKAKKIGFDEVIFLDEKGRLCEGAASNIFLIIQDKIFTPSLECPLLNGIVRQWIIKNYEVEEKTLTQQDLINSEEVFLTNSLMGVMKVNSFTYDNGASIKQYKSEFVERINKEYNRGRL